MENQRAREDNLESHILRHKEEVGTGYRAGRSGCARAQRDEVRRTMVRIIKILLFLATISTINSTVFSRTYFVCSVWFSNRHIYLGGKSHLILIFLLFNEEWW